MIEFEAEHSLGEFTVDLRFQVPSRGVTALFGASGAGKSTILALLAGAQRAQRARIAIDDAVLADTQRGIHVPIEQRRVGWVFQDARLFPHLNVERNLLFGRARRSPSRSDAPAPQREPLTAERVIDVLGLSALLHRWPRDLSGGERQRVAIGRALLSAPRLLLLDEPLASLDAARKDEILALLERIRDAFGVPMIYVTHSLAEVLRLADHLVLLENGRCLAAGPLTELLGRVETPLLTQRADAGSLLEGQLVAADPGADGTGRIALRGAAGAAAIELRVPLSGPVTLGQPIRVYVRATEVLLAAERPRAISVRNIVPTRVRRIVPRAGRNAATLVELELGAQTLLAGLTHAAVEELRLEAGAEVYALIKTVAIEAPAGRGHDLA